MFTKKKITLAVVGTAAAAFLVLTQTAGSNRCVGPNKLEGAWVMTVPGTPLLWNGILAPSDPSGRSAAIYGSLAVAIPGALLSPNVPPTDYSSDYVGEAVMTGPHTAKFSIVGHAINKVTPTEQYPFFEKVAYVWVCTGEMKFKGPSECDYTFTITDYLVGADGLPDMSKPALFSMPGTATAKRVGF